MPATERGLREAALKVAQDEYANARKAHHIALKAARERRLGPEDVEMRDASGGVIN